MFIVRLFFMRPFLNVMCALALLVTPSPADEGKHDTRDRDEISEARKRGEVLPLSQILIMVRPIIGDRVVDVEFEREDGILVYEIYYLDGDGRRHEVYVDARTGSIIRKRKKD